jgi:predicted outer membrane repeat protein
MNFENNRAASAGGALYSDLSCGILIEEVIFINNTAATESGGAACFI